MRANAGPPIPTQLAGTALTPAATWLIPAGQTITTASSVRVVDGRCGSLEEVLTGLHAPERVAGGLPGAGELRDGIQRLKSP